MQSAQCVCQTHYDLPSPPNSHSGSRDLLLFLHSRTSTMTTSSTSGNFASYIRCSTWLAVAAIVTFQLEAAENNPNLSATRQPKATSASLLMGKALGWWNGGSYMSDTVTVFTPWLLRPLEMRRRHQHIISVFSVIQQWQDEERWWSAHGS
jgi:hypothetical protein